jgi:hypothetical protein
MNFIFRGDGSKEEELNKNAYEVKRLLEEEKVTD